MVWSNYSWKYQILWALGQFCKLGYIQPYKMLLRGEVMSSVHFVHLLSPLRDFGCAIQKKRWTKILYVKIENLAFKIQDKTCKIDSFVYLEA